MLRKIKEKLFGKNNAEKIEVENVNDKEVEKKKGRGKEGKKNMK